MGQRALVGAWLGVSSWPDCLNTGSAGARRQGATDAGRRHSCVACRSRSPRFVLQTLQQPFEEALCGAGIAPDLDQDVEHNAMLIHRPPKIMLHALDPLQ